MTTDHANDASDDFVILTRRAAVPFRSRELFDGYASFRRGDDCVLVNVEVRERLARAARRADPNETGGLLVGRSLRDDQGPYVLVIGCVEASPEAGSPGMFNLSPEMTTRLRDQAARLYPGGDVVGWWHSHATWSGYSPVDVRNQRMWTDPRHVGLLVFMRAGAQEWARAYLGPECRELPVAADTPPNLESRRPPQPSGANRRPASEQPTFAPLSRQSRTPKPGRLGRRGRDGGPGSQPTRVVMVLAALFAAASVLGLVLVFNSSSGRDPATHSPPAAGSEPRVKCHLNEDGRSYECQADPPSQHLQWRVDGVVTLVEDNVLVVPARTDRGTRVELFLLDSGQEVLVDARSLQAIRQQRGDRYATATIG